MTTPEELKVSRLGERRVPSPLGLSRAQGAAPRYVEDHARVLLEVEFRDGSAPSALGFELAGVREKIFFEPSKTRVAIVTCGGLCPGINNVVRSMVLELHHLYGVREVLGFRFGFEGLNPDKGLAPIVLEPAGVRHIHKHGGSVLGLARGHQDPGVMVDTLVRHDVGALLCIGGDGTQRGTHSIAQECARRSLPIAVLGVPKTIDNDIPWVDKTFGFDTAVEIARGVIDGAHSEASSARNGVGIVKLMGRDAGFITAAASLASEEVNFCLVPEVPIELEGPNGLLAALVRRLERRAHAVIAVAEGCRSWLAAGESAAPRDASGNVRYASGAGDVGPALRDRVASYLSTSGVPSTVKYLDPSYMVRSAPANASDAIFCNELARSAVHAAMAGFTDVLVGRWHRAFTLVPLAWATGQSKRLDPTGALWLSVLESTGQPVPPRL